MDVESIAHEVAKSNHSHCHSREEVRLIDNDNEAKEGIGKQVIQTLQTSGKGWGIYFIMLQRTGTAIISRFKVIFRGYILLGYIPKEGKELRVLFILRVVKTSHITPKDYRPLSVFVFIENLRKTH